MNQGSVSISSGAVLANKEARAFLKMQAERTLNVATPTETQESIALVRWMTDHGLVFCHVANERKCSPQEGRIKKAMGPGANPWEE